MGERQDCAVSAVITTCKALYEIFLPSLSTAMPQQTRFYGYNIIHDEQRDRLGAVAVPIATSLAGAGAVLNTYSLYQDVNIQRTPAIFGL
jgi:hypothetical protein